MPKLKTHRGTAKRVKMTANKKILRERANGTHFQEKKNKSRKRVISSDMIVSGANKRNFKRALGV